MHMPSQVKKTVLLDFNRNLLISQRDAIEIDEVRTYPKDNYGDASCGILSKRIDTH
jgi:hypothetical protein